MKLFLHSPPPQSMRSMAAHSRKTGHYLGLPATSVASVLSVFARRNIAIYNSVMHCIVPHPSYTLVQRTDFCQWLRAFLSSAFFTRYSRKPVCRQLREHWQCCGGEGRGGLSLTGVRPHRPASSPCEPTAHQWFSARVKNAKENAKAFITSKEKCSNNRFRKVNNYGEMH